MKNNPDSYSEFENWFLSSFHKRNGGYFPQDLKGWYDRSVTKHNGLVKLFGGFRLQNKYVLKSHQNPASEEDVKQYVDRLVQLLPDYLGTYNYNRSVFTRPLIQTGTHSFVKTGKHVNTYASKALIYYKSQYLEVQKILSELGNIWARYRTSDTELEITISCAPQAFALLGHYGPDHDSCFRQGSSSQKDKYVLGQSQDTFVITISQFDTKKQKNKNVARLFGFAAKNFTVFNICNCYFAKHFRDGDAVETIRMLMADIFKTNEITAIEDLVYVDRGVHFNRNGLNLSFIKGKDARLPETQVLFPNCHLISSFSCPRCGEQYESDSGWYNVDDEQVCNYCMHNAHTCEKTRRKTFRQLESFLDSDKIIYNVHPDYVAGFKRCSNCNIATYSLTNNVCDDCLDNLYTECDNCGKSVSDTEIVDVGDISVCNSCLSNKETKHEILLDIYGELSVD